MQSDGYYNCDIRQCIHILQDNIEGRVFIATLLAFLFLLEVDRDLFFLLLALILAKLFYIYVCCILPKLQKRPMQANPRH
jgi:hypothetical protein